MFRAIAPSRATAGFTLIEVLVALAVVAVVLAPLGRLIATNVRGVHAIEGRLTALETARAVMTALPQRDQLAPGVLAGELAGHRWRVEISPFLSGETDRAQRPEWLPLLVVATVTSPLGVVAEISTIRLHRSHGR